MNAIPDRRSLLAGLCAVGGAVGLGGALSGCQDKMPMTASTTPMIDLQRLEAAVEEIARRAAPAAFGMGLVNLESGQSFVYQGDRTFPMQSVFKMLLAAAALAEVDARRLNLGETVTLDEGQLSPQHSPIAEAWPARRDYTLQELLRAAVLESDNTAADVLMKRIGGPGAVTAWLSEKRVFGVRVDRYERELQVDVYGMPSFRPGWRDNTAFAAARNAVPPARRLAAMNAAMRDVRDSATPRGMVTFLQALDRGDLLSPASTRVLLGLMSETPSGPGRIRAGLPAGAFLAHKTGSSGIDQGLSTAQNDVGIFRLKDGRAYALALFLSGSRLDDAGRDGILAQATGAAVRAVG